MVGGVHMLLSVWAANQVAEISYDFSLDLQIIKLVPDNYCFCKTLILKLFSVCCRYYEASGCCCYRTKFEDTCHAPTKWSNARTSHYGNDLFLGDIEHNMYQCWQGDTRHTNCQTLSYYDGLYPVLKKNLVHIWNCLSKWRVDGSLDKAMHEMDINLVGAGKKVGKILQLLQSNFKYFSNTSFSRCITI